MTNTYPTKLTEDKLRLALRTIMSQDMNIDQLVLMDQYAGMDDETMLKTSVDDLYSDELLEHLNKNMHRLYAIECRADDQSITAAFDELRESCIADNDLELPVLVEKPAVCVGFYQQKIGCYDGMLYESGYCTYIDVDGNVFCTNEQAIYLNGEIENPPAFVARTLSDKLVFPCLSEVLYYLPDTYDDFWDY